MKKSFLLASAFFVFGCAPSSPKLVPRSYTEKVSSDEVVMFNPRVDILFVIDDSGSMSSHQDRLSKNVASITKSLDKAGALDYHIGVITSTMEKGYSSGTNYGGRLVSEVGFPKFVDRSTPDGIEILQRYIEVGTNGSATEKFFEPIDAALVANANGYNKGFYRPEAFLVLIFITDADDQSLRNGNDYSAKDFIASMLKLKGGVANKIIPYGILIPTSSSASGDCSRAEPAPVKLEDVISTFKGHEYDLCDPDYNDNLDFLGKDIADRAGKYLYLKRRPVQGSITVNFGGKPVPQDAHKGWAFDAEKNAIVFGDELMESLSGIEGNLEVNYTAIPY